MIRNSIRALALTAALAGFAAATPARAADLVIAFESPTTTMDPHFSTTPKDFTVNSHIFEPLLRRDNESSKPEPWLATSWKQISEKLWEFKLRPNVKWHDGSPFTAEDVVFSYGRIPIVPNAPSRFTNYTKFFEKLEVVDPLTLRIHTNTPAPGLLVDLTYLLIVSKKHGESGTTGDYNSGKAAIGTGAYKFSSHIPNDNTVVTRNGDYWGEKQAWDKVTFRMMPSAGPRTSALLAGDVDVIEAVPSADLARMKAEPKVSLWSKTSSRIAIYLLTIGDGVLDTNLITDMNGGKLTKNPLADKKVRQAMYAAVNLDAFVNRVMEGQAIAYGQYFMPEGLGYNPDIKVPAYNIEKARALLKEAGWDNKFKLTLSTYPGAFANSDQVAGALAQAWTQIGIPTSVVVTPYAVLLRERGTFKIPASINSFANSAPTGDSMFTGWLHTATPKFGAFNKEQYSNPEVDKLIEASMVEFDEKKRADTLAQATKLAVDDAVIAPLWLFKDTTGTKSHLTFTPRADRLILATNVKPKGS